MLELNSTYNFLPIAILVTISIPIFILLKKVFPKNNNLVTFLLMLISDAILYALFIFIALQSISYYKKSEFNQTVWKSDWENRYKMVDDILEEDILIGLSLNEVENLLGSGYGESGSNIFYMTGYSPSIISLESDKLYLYIKDGTVIGAGRSPSF